MPKKEYVVRSPRLKALIHELLDECEGNKTRLCDLLGIKGTQTLDGYLAGAVASPRSAMPALQRELGQRYRLPGEARNRDWTPEEVMGWMYPDPLAGAADINWGDRLQLAQTSAEEGVILLRESVKILAEMRGEISDRTLVSESEVSQYKDTSMEQVMCENAYRLFREAIARKLDIDTDQGYREFCRLALMKPGSERAERMKRVAKGESAPGAPDWEVMTRILRDLGDDTKLAEVFNCPTCREV